MKAPGDSDAHPLDEIMNLAPIKRKKVIMDLAAGREVSFHHSPRGDRAPTSFAIRTEEGGFKVRSAQGRHIGSYSDFNAAWQAGRDFARAPIPARGRDPWGKDFPKTMALLRR